MTKEDILHHFQDINFYYGDCMMYADLSGMLDELIAENKGEWIKTKDQYGTYHFTCSKCGNDIATKSDVWNDNFCSECGAKMKGGE